MKLDTISYHLSDNSFIIFIYVLMSFWLSNIIFTCSIIMMTPWGILTQAAIPMLAALSMNYLIMQRAVKSMGNQIVVETVVGEGKKVNPAFNLYQRAFESYLAIAAKFGLTPFDRAKLVINKPYANGSDGKIQLR